MSTHGGDPTEPIVPPARVDGTTPLRRPTSFMFGNAIATLLVVIVIGLIVAGAARSFVPGTPAAAPSTSPSPTAADFTPRPLPSFTPTPTPSPTPSPSPTPTLRPTPQPTRTPAPPTKTPVPTKTP